MKAVLFDLDGVITDTAEYHYLAWKALGKDLGIEIDREFNEELKGVSRVDSLDRILAHGHQSDRYSSQEKVEFAQKKNALYLEMIKKMTPNDILPGIVSLLKALKEQGIKVGLASASKNGPAILELLELTSFFNAVANPDSVAAGKPAPDIFLKAAELLDESASECVGVEDASSGVTAINDAGMVSIGIGESAQLHHAALLLSTTKELNVPLLEKTWVKFHK